MVEHAHTQVAQEALADPRHHPHLHAAQHHGRDGDTEERERRPVERGAVVAAEAVVDAVAHEGWPREQRTGGTHHDDARQDHRAAVGAQHGGRASQHPTRGLGVEALVVLDRDRRGPAEAHHRSAPTSPWSGTPRGPDPSPSAA